MESPRRQGQKGMIFYDKEKLYLHVTLGIRGQIGGWVHRIFQLFIF